LIRVLKFPIRALRRLTRTRYIRKIRFLGRRALEAFLYGGRFRESFLVGLLGALHRSQYRREWLYRSSEPPPFYNQRWNGFEFVYGKSRNPYPFTRGFLVSEVIRSGDRLLDIGCGDGFFTNTFYSPRCRHVDAIDIEPSAIATAKRLNSARNVDFYVLDAVADPFPSDRYDVIVWDGAIGHFADSDLSTVLEKIVGALSPSGIFVGSESLGIEGSDHLQFFEDEAALAASFEPYFEHVLIRTEEYQIGTGFLRREAYWRCANDPSLRHDPAAWKDFAGGDVREGGQIR
jgi:SAM-dependent methyltransferase